VKQKTRYIRRRKKRHHNYIKNVSWVWDDHAMKWRKAGNIRAQDLHNGFVNIYWGVRNQAAMLTKDDARKLSADIEKILMPPRYFVPAITQEMADDCVIQDAIPMLIKKNSSYEG
jgi:hypothetical protein